MTFNKGIRNGPLSTKTLMLILSVLNYAKHLYVDRHFFRLDIFLSNFWSTKRKTSETRES